MTLLYAGLFTVSVAVLFAVIYWSSSLHMTNQLDTAVESDVAELTQGYRLGGGDRLARLIAGRVEEMPAGPMFYLLEDRAGHVLAGNLPATLQQTGTFDVVDPRAVPHHADLRPLRAHGTLLNDGDYLMVAIDASQRDEMEEAILRAFGWGSLTSLLLAFSGGLMLSGGLLRRVEAISRTARDIMGGHLSRRVPSRGADDEFDHLAASLNAMLDRTESSMHAMRQISNDIAHDLRTPLTRLRQRLELAQRKAVSAVELRAAVAESIADTDSILATFGALLRIAQIESKVIKAGFAAFDLSELLETVVEVYQPMAEDKHQRFTTEITAGLQGFGDRELLAQLFSNLVENALRHTPCGVFVRLAAWLDGQQVTVVLSDNGPGIPRSEHANVFRRFYRLEASRTTPGDGLGLSLVAAIAGLHDISIELDDNHPGLRVTLRLGGLPAITAAAGNRALAAPL